MSRLFTGRQRTADVMLSRFGTEVTIRRPDGTATLNEYGKVEDSDQTYNTVTTERAVRWYRARDDHPGEARVTGGRIDTENPWLFVAHDTQMQEDDRIEFSDTNQTYVVDELISRQTHTEARVTPTNG